MERIELSLSENRLGKGDSPILFGGKFTKSRQSFACSRIGSEPDRTRRVRSPSSEQNRSMQELLKQFAGLAGRDGPPLDVDARL